MAFSEMLLGQWLIPAFAVAMVMRLATFVFTTPFNEGGKRTRFCWVLVLAGFGLIGGNGLLISLIARLAANPDSWEETYTVLGFAYGLGIVMLGICSFALLASDILRWKHRIQQKLTMS